MEGNRVREKWFRNSLHCMERRGGKKRRYVGQKGYDKKRKPE